MLGVQYFYAIRFFYNSILQNEKNLTKSKGYHFELFLKQMLTLDIWYVLFYKPKNLSKLKIV